MFRNTLSGRSPGRCLCTWSCFCAYRMTVTVPVSMRFSLTQTLQGEQYQFIKATIYPPLLLPESHRNWKFRNAESSQGHSRSHAVLRSHADWAKSLRLSRSGWTWTLKTAEQDEKHTVQWSKLEPMATVTIIKYGSYTVQKHQRKHT